MKKHTVLSTLAMMTLLTNVAFADDSSTAPAAPVVAPTATSPGLTPNGVPMADVQKVKEDKKKLREDKKAGASKEQIKADKKELHQDRAKVRSERKKAHHG